jgi:hypothetical protein
MITRTTIAAFMLLFACSGPASQAPSTPGPTSSSAVVGAARTLEDVAVAFAKAALSGDRETARSLALTHEQLAELATRAPDRATYDQELAAFLDKAALDNADNPLPEGQIVSARVVETHRVPPGDKVKREVELAAVYLVVERDGQRSDSNLPFFFIRTADGWRFSLQK